MFRINDKKVIPNYSSSPLFKTIDDAVVFTVTNVLVEKYYEGLDTQERINAALDWVIEA